ncbi:hypothetical protein [Halobellus rufus]|uniref:hypothetical protein n=1 Tax=Halobellus rufus TaxID=1448860 RepID=UPI000679BF7B|nr:hypothetical protein [Halobellus rufus]
MPDDESYRERYRDVLQAVEEHTSRSRPLVERRKLAIVVAETTDWKYSDIKDTIDAAIDRDDLFHHYRQLAPMEEDALLRIAYAEERTDGSIDNDLIAHCNQALRRLRR